jgi:hypothetical protein
LILIADSGYGRCCEEREKKKEKKIGGKRPPFKPNQDNPSSLLGRRQNFAGAVFDHGRVSIEILYY